MITVVSSIVASGIAPPKGRKGEPGIPGYDGLPGVKVSKLNIISTIPL